MKLAVEQHGHGPDLVILHGLFGSSRNWRSHVRVLAETMRVTVVDMRNHGQSPHDSEMSYLDMASDLTESLAAEGLEDAAVLGHSMGGKALMTMALQHLDWAGPMIVVDIAPVCYPPRFAAILQGLQSLPIATLRSRGEADRLLSERIPEAAYRTFLLTNLVRSGEGFRWRVNLPTIISAMPEIEAFPLTTATPSPVRSLFLRGSRSNYVDAEGEVAIQKLFPNSTIETVPNAGHWVHADQPELLIEAVSAFVLGS